MFQCLFYDVALPCSEPRTVTVRLDLYGRVLPVAQPKNKARVFLTSAAMILARASLALAPISFAHQTSQAPVPLLANFECRPGQLGQFSMKFENP